MGLCSSKDDTVHDSNNQTSSGVQRTSRRKDLSSSETSKSNEASKSASVSKNDNAKTGAETSKSKSKNKSKNKGKDIATTNNSSNKTSSSASNDTLEKSGNDEMKVLLLGTGESGKSTVLQQLKILHQGGFTDDELLSGVSLIHGNLIEMGHNILEARQKFNIDDSLDGITEDEIHNFSNYDFNIDNKIMNNQYDEKDEKLFPKEFISLLDKLWSSQQTQDLLNGPHSSEFYMMDSTPYFLEHDTLMRVTAEDYIPTPQDVLRSRQKTSGIFDTHINMGSNLKLHFFDVGGQRSERKKWIHCFDNVALVIFCVSLSEYDQFLIEDVEQNRFQESLVLFDNIVNSRWFARTSIVLFLNKIDLFAEKLKKKPLEDYFPDYNGGDDINKATKYILWRFVQLNRANLNIYPHVTQATDTSNIELVFATIKETMLENSLKDTGIMN